MNFSIEALNAPLGAEISGLDIDVIDAAVAEQLRQTWYRYQVLIVRNSKILSDDSLVRFGACFGPIENARKRSPLATRPEIMVISNIRKDGEALGALPDGELSFHYDRVHQEKPNKAGVLHAVEIPVHGGDTCFGNMYVAYEALDPALQRRLEGLKALNTYEYGTTTPGAKHLSEGAPTAVHPVVRTIPETGRKALYVSRLMTDRIIGLPEAEGEALLAQLRDHCERPEFIYQHKWRVGDLLIWDNRCVTHARTDFPPEQRRLLKRVTVGDTQRPS